LPMASNPDSLVGIHDRANADSERDCDGSIIRMREHPPLDPNT
jgi:hypothetical protein